MPKKKNYPNWFYAWSKPSPPTKPQEFIKKQVVLETVSLSHGYPVELNNEDFKGPEDATHYEIKVHYGYYDNDVEGIDIIFSKYTDVKNPDYNRSMTWYNTEYHIYQERLKEWKVLKKKWDEENKEEDEARERRQLKKLQQKYKDF